MSLSPRPALSLPKGGNEGEGAPMRGIDAVDSQTFEK